MSTARSAGPKVSLDQLFRNGVVVDLDISTYRAHAKIQAQDLGIKESDEVHKALSLGKHRLVSPESMAELREIEAKVKRKVEYYSMSFPFVYGVRFVPNTVAEKLFAELIELRDRHSVLADEYCEKKYRQAVKEQLVIILKALQDASDDPEIVKAAYDRIRSLYPPPEVVRKKFGIRWKVFSISGSSNPAAAAGAQEEAEVVRESIRQMIVGLREELVEKVGMAMSFVAKGAKLPEPSYEAAMEVLSRIESMNVFGDEVLAKQSEQLRKVIEMAMSDSTTKKERIGMVPDLAGVLKTMEGSGEQAVKAAEEALTGVGRRRIG
jgi:hypothetical protein